MATNAQPLNPNVPIGQTKSGELVYLTTDGMRFFDAIRGEIDVDGTLVGSEENLTFVNKLIDADDNTISNLRHGAEVDSPVSGVHGVTGLVVGTSDAQTLTNKTLTSPSLVTPAISNPTGLNKGDVGLNLVDNTSDVTKNAAAATLTNKTFGNPPIFPAHAVASLPDATALGNGVIIVTDETGGRTLATSNGTDWIRVSDGAIVS